MKEFTTQAFLAFDGTPFFDRADCERHEENSFPMRFVGLTLEQVVNAFDRMNAELADAFETAGNLIAVKRRDSGELRRRGPKGNGAADPPPQISTGAEDRRDPEEIEVGSTEDSVPSLRWDAILRSRRCRLR